jgi:ubiquinone/menaquinone biosynthesis C-methylase UbiE
VTSHYTHGQLLLAIRQGLQKLGKTEHDVTLEDLGPVEEFHIGGRQASAEFLDQLELAPDDVVLDVGCGLGGASRFAASRYGCRLIGVDLTEEYVATGQVICKWVGLQDRILLEQGSATALKFADDAFNKAYMMHVGMNIADKTTLMKELFRVLKPGGLLGIYDVMQTSSTDLAFPVPWASEPGGSALAAPDKYILELERAGFRIVGQRDRREFAMTFFDQLQAKTQAVGGPPPLGLHILMGPNAPQKIANMVENVKTGRIAPVEVFASKP